MTIWIWAAFLAFILLMLALDLGVFNRHSHVISVKEAFGWTAFWIAIAGAFNVVVYFMYEHHWLGIGMVLGHELDGGQAALQFLTGYVIEKSLSLDNIFVIALIFNYFAVPAEYQHRVLFWGILGALVMRGVMIGAGAVLISTFSWIEYVFGAILLVTAVRMLLAEEGSIEPEKNPLVRLARRMFPITTSFHGNRFFVRAEAGVAATPLLLVLLLVESTDVVFAVDSIPAIFAVTRDPFIVFTSNVFAILGLRSLYFALAGAMRELRYMKISLVFVLAFVGVKMLLGHVVHIGTTVSLGVIGGTLFVGGTASWLAARRERRAAGRSDQEVPGL